MASEVMLLTSAQEGFGLPYLEAAAFEKPLIARHLPNVVPDLLELGFSFPHLYEEILIAPNLLDLKRERGRQQRLWREWKAAMPSLCRRLARRPVLLNLSPGEPLPFSRLTLTGQLEVLAIAPEQSWEACLPANPFLQRLACSRRDETTRGDAMAQRCRQTGERPRLRRPLLGCCRQYPAAAGTSARRGTGAARFNRATAENELPLPHPFRRGMNPVRAIIFDVYKTILDVGEAPSDAEKRWRNLLVQTFGSTLDVSLDELANRCAGIVREDHNEARGRGINHPEVNWPTVMKRALPILDSLPEARLADFIFQHAQLFADSQAYAFMRLASSSLRAEWDFTGHRFECSGLHAPRAPGRIEGGASRLRDLSSRSDILVVPEWLQQTRSLCFSDPPCSLAQSRDRGLGNAHGR